MSDQTLETSAELRADMRARLAELEAENQRLLEAVAKMSHRRCWDCGHVDYYLADTLPECACAECGSADTRLIREAKS